MARLRWVAHHKPNPNPKTLTLTLALAPTLTRYPSQVGGAFTSKSKYNIDDFKLLKVLGKGAFGKVRRTLTLTANPTPNPNLVMVRLTS